VIRTRVGYGGGTSDQPTYRNIGDHTETIQIDFDPKQITYRQLLGVYWDSHDPTFRSWSQQYKSVIFFHDQRQKRLAVETMEGEQARRGKKIFTEVLPVSTFTRAEDYHQKYRLRQNRRLMSEFAMLLPSGESFVNSTVAARVNGFLGGYGKLETLRSEIDSYGLSEKAKQRLLNLFEP